MFTTTSMQRTILLFGMYFRPKKEPQSYLARWSRQNTVLSSQCLAAAVASPDQRTRRGSFFSRAEGDLVFVAPFHHVENTPAPRPRQTMADKVTKVDGLEKLRGNCVILSSYV